MNKIQALKRVYKYNHIMRRAVDKLVLVKPDMDACALSKICKIALGNVYMFAGKYKIKLASKRHSNLREVWLANVKERYVPRWDKRFSIKANAKVLGVSYANAMKISREFNLGGDGVAGKMQLTTVKHIERIKEYQKKGLKDAEIARVLGMTRERIRQLSLMKDF